MFTEYKFDADAVESLVTEKAQNLRQNRGLSDLLSFGLSIVVQRLKKDPLRYRDYGPYWPELKNALRRGGYDLGDKSDPLVAAEYKGRTDTHTLVMAEEFRNLYLATMPVYTNQFALDGETGEMWTLFDEDMEQKASHHL